MNTTLTRLGLCQNPIMKPSPVGLIALSEALACNRLSRLDLSWTSLGQSGAEILSVGLQQNRSITNLDLSGNSFGDAGMLALIPAFNANCGICELDLASNNVTTATASKLSQALLTVTLTALTFNQGMSMTVHELAEFLNSMCQHPQLRTIAFGSCGDF